MAKTRFTANKDAEAYAESRRMVFILRVRIFSIIFCLLLLSYIVLTYFTPFGVTRRYSLSAKTVSDLAPLSRTEKTTVGGEEATVQKDDLIYFTTKYPFRFDKAKVKIRFQNHGSSQKIELGFKDKNLWHYDTQILDLPFMHSAEWQHVGAGPALYERTKAFDSVNQFFEDYPAKALIGTLDYPLPAEDLRLSDYTPKQGATVIDTPLRGQHTMYVYVDDEPFYLKVRKQDLNWYSDPDVLEVRVYKENTLVFTAIIDDDGIADDSRQPGLPQEVEIKNPGPGLPEPGVYKITFDGFSDTLITRLETNLHKIVFAGHVYPAANSKVYLPVERTATTTIYTNSRNSLLTAQHDAALQDIYVNGSVLSLREKGEPKTALASTSTVTTEIMLPQSDVEIEGSGFYSLAQDQFFLPSQFNAIPIFTNQDTEMADYILSAYKPTISVEGGYLETEREFDLSTAVPDKNKLSWMIRAPGLKEAGNRITIQDIQVEYSKEGWLGE